MVETIILFMVLAGVFIFSVVAVLCNLRRKNLPNNTGTIGRIEADTKTVGDRVDTAKSGIGESKKRIDRNVETVGDIKGTVDEAQGRLAGNIETTGRVAESVNRSTDINKRFGEILDDVERGNSK